MERVDFMAIVALQRRFRTISDRPPHLAALSALSCSAQTVRAGRTSEARAVALDGTRSANGVKHKAMSYERMCKREAELQAEVDGWSRRRRRRTPRRTSVRGRPARRRDAGLVADKQRGWPRFAKPRQNEAEAKAKRRPAAVRAKVDRSHRANLRRRQHQTESERNFTIRKAHPQDKDGYIQGYMSQPRSTLTRNQLWRTVGNMGQHQKQFVRCSIIKTNLGSNPPKVSADAGYCFDRQSSHAEPGDGINATSQPERQRHGSSLAQGPPNPARFSPDEQPRSGAPAIAAALRLRKQVARAGYSDSQGGEGIPPVLLREIKGEGRNGQ